MIGTSPIGSFCKDKLDAFIWTILFLSPILGWVSVLVLGIAGLSQLRYWHAIKLNFQNHSVLIASLIILLYLIVLFTVGRVDEFGLKAFKFPAGLLIPVFLLVWFNKRKVSEDFISASAVYAVMVISILMGFEWLVYKSFYGIDSRVRGFSANPLFVSAMLLPLQLLAIHNFQQASRAFKKVILLSWLMGLVCLVIFLGARASFIILLGLSSLSFFIQLKGKKDRLRFIFVALILIILITTLFHYLAEFLYFVQRMKMLLDFIVTFDGNLIEDESMRLRVSVWHAAWHAIVQQPWFGYGFAQEHFTLAQYLPKGEIALSTSHQEYLSFMLGAGIFGLISGVLYLLFPLLALVISRPRRRLALCLVIPFLLNGFTDTLFDDLRIMFYYTTMGFMLISAQASRQ